MAKQIFDQDRPRSAMARRLDEAFAGCEEWTVAPGRRRAASLDFELEPAAWLQPRGRREAPPDEQLPQAA